MHKGIFFACFSGVLKVHALVSDNVLDTLSLFKESLHFSLEYVFSFPDTNFLPKTQKNIYIILYSFIQNIYLNDK